jgi:hypothetical protein
VSGPSQRTLGLQSRAMLRPVRTGRATRGFAHLDAEEHTLSIFDFLSSWCLLLSYLYRGVSGLGNGLALSIMGGTTYRRVRFLLGDMFLLLMVCTTSFLEVFVPVLLIVIQIILVVPRWLPGHGPARRKILFRTGKRQRMHELGRIRVVYCSQHGVACRHIGDATVRIQSSPIWPGTCGGFRQ